MYAVAVIDEQATLAIRRRIREAGLTQTELAQRVGRVQSWVSSRLFIDPDATIRHLAYKDPVTFNRLLNALQWTTEELNEATGLAIPMAHERSEPIFTYIERSGDKADPRIRLPIYGSLAAGIKGFEIHAEPEDFRLFDPAELPKGIQDYSRLYLVRANGDSMMEEGLTRPVPEGSMLMVEDGAHPEHNQLVVAYIPELDVGVVKQYQEKNEDVVLKSYKIRGPMFWASQYPSMRIEGVVRRVTYEP